MNCPEHLVLKAFNDRLYLWLYWADVPRKMIPLRVWLNPLRYELFIRLRGRVWKLNPEGRAARRVEYKAKRLWCAIFGHRRNTKLVSPVCARCYAAMPEQAEST